MTLRSTTLGQRQPKLLLMLLLLCCCCCCYQHFFPHSASTCCFVDAKRLILFAGPHHAASSSVEQFFYHYAAEHKRKQKDTFGLRRWRWPHFNTTGEDSSFFKDHPRPYQVMENLVTESTNDEMQQELLNGIQETWTVPGDGMILGTAEFDRSAGGHVQGLMAMKRVVKSLDPPPHNVTVVLNYRTPRIDQWLTMWYREQLLAFEKDDDGVNITYQDYMCNPNTLHFKEEIMATAMNAMEIVYNIITTDNTELEEEKNDGWNVVLMDLAGIEAAGRDVATVIACDVLGAVCDDGKLRNHAEHPYHETDQLLVEDSKLSKEDVALAEELLLGRDCYYEPFLRNNPRVSVVHNTSVWSTCDPTKLMENAYERLTESDILFRALLSQMECDNKALPEHMITVDQALNGQVPTTEKEWKKNDKQYIKKATPAGSSGSSGGGGGVVELFLFPLVLLSAGAFQVYRMQQERVESIAVAATNGAAVQEAEMNEINGGGRGGGIVRLRNNNGGGGGGGDEEEVTFS